MQANKVYLASDHGGFKGKEIALKYCKERGFLCVDLGCNSPEISVDYSDFANALAAHLENDKGAKGILVCGSGIGISIAANRHKHIRCALCHDENTAMLSRLHNDANILALGGRVVGPGLALKIVDTLLDTPFSGEERHMRRIAQIETE